ncbi:hypothetical protein SUGI_0092670 [Cryptomeria japonica]|nr:hypothetical protein SUGI_0092670 [Cryptomeria japonica]
MKDVLIALENNNELGKRVSIAGEKFGHLSLSKDDLISSLEEMIECLQEVEQSPSQLIQNAIVSTVNSLGEHRLLRHLKKEVRQVVPIHLSEIIRIITPEIPYKDDIMKEVLQLTMVSLHGLHDDKAPTSNRRTKKLDIVARTRFFFIMLVLHRDELILQMFQCFITEIRQHHPNKVKTDIFDILSMILDENDIVCE